MTYGQSVSAHPVVGRQLAFRVDSAVDDHAADRGVNVDDFIGIRTGTACLNGSRPTCFSVGRPCC